MERLDQSLIDVAAKALAEAVTSLVSQRGHTEGLEKDAASIAEAMVSGLRAISESVNAQ